MIVADTHALIWWVQDSPELSRRARDVMNRTDRIGVPLVCCYEIAVLVDRRRVMIGADIADWLDAALALPRVTLLPLNVRVCVTASMLPDTIRDPADRLIVATAFHQGLPLVTRDHKIRGARMVETIW